MCASPFGSSKHHADLTIASLDGHRIADLVASHDPISAGPCLPKSWASLALTPTYKGSGDVTSKYDEVPVMSLKIRTEKPALRRAFYVAVVVDHIPVHDAQPNGRQIIYSCSP